MLAVALCRVPRGSQLRRLRLQRSSLRRRADSQGKALMIRGDPDCRPYPPLSPVPTGPRGPASGLPGSSAGVSFAPGATLSNTENSD